MSIGKTFRPRRSSPKNFVCVQLPSSNVSSSRQMTLASIKKTRKANDGTVTNKDLRSGNILPINLQYYVNV